MSQCFCYPTVEDCKACEAAERYSRQEVLACQSALVDELTQQEMPGFEWDQIENLYDEACLECGGETEPDGEWRLRCRECHCGFDSGDTSPKEIFEWWLVSPYLAEWLKEIGQPVLDNGFGTWWGRCTTGQSMVMDGVLQEVYRASQRRLAELLKE